MPSKISQFEANFDTFKPNSPSVQSQSSPLKGQNQDLDLEFDRKSISNSVSEKEHHNELEGNSQKQPHSGKMDLYLVEYRKARNLHTQLSRTKVSDIKSEINNLIERMEDASRSFFQPSSPKVEPQPMSNPTFKPVQEFQDPSSIEKTENWPIELNSENWGSHEIESKVDNSPLPVQFFTQSSEIHDNQENIPVNVDKLASTSQFGPQEPVDKQDLDRQQEIQRLTMEIEISRKQQELQSLIFEYKMANKPEEKPTPQKTQNQTQTKKQKQNPKQPTSNQPQNKPKHLDPKSLEKQLKTAQRANKKLAKEKIALEQTLKQQEVPTPSPYRNKIVLSKPRPACSNPSKVSTPSKI